MPGQSSWQCRSRHRSAIWSARFHLRGRQRHSPQMGAQRVIPGPKWCRGRCIAFIGGRGLQGCGIRCQFDQRLFQKGRPHEIRRIRMRHPPRMRRRPIDKPAIEVGRSPARAVSATKTNFASRHGLSMPSTGTVKSTDAADPGDRSRYFAFGSCGTKARAAAPALSSPENSAR